MGQIAIENMEFYAYHGHFSAEQVVGNKFIVQLWFETNTDMAAQTDRLDDTVNYQAVYLLIQEEMKTPAKLLEHLCNRILNKLHAAFPTIETSTLKIQKMNPPMGGQIGSVSVQLSKHRN